MNWLTRKRWPLVAVAAVCGALVGYFIAFAADPTYTSKATLYVAPPISSSPTDAVMGDQYADNRTQLYLQLIKSDELAGLVAKELKSSEPAAALVKSIDAIRVHQAPLLEIEARGSSPEAAHSLAKAYVDQLPEFARSVEQNSGLREGSALVSVAGPTEITQGSGGLQPWLTLIFCTVLFAGAASAYVIRRSSRNPTARNIGALRRAMPTSFIAEVGHDPADILKFGAMLFAAPHSTRQVIFAGARRADALEEFTSELTRSLRGAGIACTRVKSGDPVGSNGGDDDPHTITVFDAPGLLDDSHRIAALALRSRTAVIVARRTTLVEDVVQLQKLLNLNGIAVKGVISARRTSAKDARRHDEVIGVASDGAPGDTHPTPELLEAGTGPRRESPTRDE